MKAINKQNIINYINNNRDIHISDIYSNEQLAGFLLQIYKTKKNILLYDIYNMIGYLYMEEYAQPDPSDSANDHNDELWAVGME